MADTLERELATFTRLLPDLMKEEGKFALVIGHDLEGIYETRREALLIGYRKAKFGPFLVKKIS